MVTSNLRNSLLSLKVILAAALTLSGGLNEEFVSRGLVEFTDYRSIYLSFAVVAFNLSFPYPDVAFAEEFAEALKSLAPTFE
jgi:hypothetical protein